MSKTFQYDVVIAGGGTAGVAAAVGAARAKAKTLLIEREILILAVRQHIQASRHFVDSIHVGAIQ